MPNFKIIQDVADQARVKIYGDQNLPLKTDSSGNLAITISQALSITTGSDTMAVTTGLIKLTSDTLTVTTGLVQITAPDALTVTTGLVKLTSDTLTVTTGLVQITAPDALTVTTGLVKLTSDTLTVTTGLVQITAPDALTVTTGLVQITAPDALTVTTGLVKLTSDTLTVAPGTTDVSVNASNITSSTFLASDYFTVLPFNVWTIGVYSNSTSGNNAALKLQVSPDGTHYIDDDPTETTLPATSLHAFVSGYHFKYARMYYRAVDSNSAVTLNIFFQGHN